MSHSRRRLVLSALAVFTLTGGTYASAQDGGWTGVQSEDPGPVKCYAEVCDGGQCLKQQIVCPIKLIPIN
jgi:hypothetical protein